MRARCSRETEPWWARATRGGAPGPAPAWAIISAGSRPPASGSLAVAPLGGELVEPGGQPLGEPPGVGEDDGRAVRLDQVEDALLDVRPDRRTPLGAGRRPGHVAGRLAEGGHVLDRHHHLQLDRLLRGRRDHRDRPPARQEPGDLLDGPHRGGQADPLGGRVEQQRRAARARRRGGRRAWSATACTSSTITVSTPRSASRAALVSSRKSDSGVVMRMSGGRRAKLRRSSAGVSPERRRDRDVRLGQAEPGGGLPDAGQRDAEVALDVDGERLERADVEHPAAPARVVRRRRRGQAVERREEGGQRLAGSGRGDDQRVVPRPIASHAPRWAAVGAAKAPSNQARVAGEKPSIARTDPSCTAGTTNSSGRRPGSRWYLRYLDRISRN